MEDIKTKEFLSIGYGDGSGYWDGSGSGWGNGSGFYFGDSNGSLIEFCDCYGDGSGNDIGSGHGNGNSDGEGDGSDAGSGSGDDFFDGSGNGRGTGSGFGDGDRDGYSIKSILGLPVYTIDGVQTIITSIKGNVAKGKILNRDLTTTPCFIVKQGDMFAHGKTLHEAQTALGVKLFNDKPLDEKIDAFIDKFANGVEYSARDFYDWHGRLTGSCPLGREQFVRDRGIDLDSSMTVTEFIQLTENEYGSDIIKAVKKRYM